MESGVWKVENGKTPFTVIPVKAGTPSPASPAGRLRLESIPQLSNCDLGMKSYFG
jgi:hypothetical protein